MKPYVTVGIRNRTLTESYGILASYMVPLVGSDCMIEKALDVGEGIPVRTCYEVEDRKRLRELFEKEIREGKYTQAFFDTIDKAYKDTVQDIKRFWKENLSKASRETLWEYYERFFKIYITTLHPMVLAIYASDLQDVFETELKGILKDVAHSQIELIEYTALLLTPTRLTTVQKEEQLLFELEQSFETTRLNGDRNEYLAFIQEPTTREKFEQLAELYGWFHMEYLGEPKTSKDYQNLMWDRIEDVRKAGGSLKDQVSPKERLADIVRRQKEFFSQHEVSEFFKQLVFAMQEFLIVLDFSKADLIEGIWYARPLLEEIGKRAGLPSWIEVRYLLPKELREHLLAGTTSSQDYIRVRKQHFAMLLENRKITPYFGTEATKVVDRLLEREQFDENTTEFKGMIAYPGKVQGTVCVITLATERHKFKQGLILVTRDTTTELTSVIKQSIAIVADQAGLLSHTAIVAREFKIPCIVQTKIGTKILKDGDCIEVDASCGIVRILGNQ